MGEDFSFLDLDFTPLGTSFVLNAITSLAIASRRCRGNATPTCAFSLS